MAYRGGRPRLRDCRTPGRQLKIVVFSDFQCEYCKELAARLDTLALQFPSEVAVIYRHFPLPAHSAALEAAVASECAGEQDQFKQYHDQLYASQSALGSKSWTEIATSAELRDVELFETCLSNGAATARVAKDTKSAQALGLRSTPSLLIGDHLITGAPPTKHLIAMVHEALKDR